MRTAITLLITSILFMGITVTMFGTSNTTSAEINRQHRWENAQQEITWRQ